jgi:hypothetical protein
MGIKLYAVGNQLKYDHNGTTYTVPDTSLDVDSMITTYLDRHDIAAIPEQTHNSSSWVKTIDADRILAHNARYKITLSYEFSTNHAGSDFMCDLEINDAVVYEHREEVKEVNNQSLPRGFTFITENALPVGTNSFQLYYKAESNGRIMRMKNAHITIERWV